LVDTASCSPALAEPGRAVELPRGREDNARIRRVARNVDRACFIIDEEHALPRLAAVTRSEDAALLLRAVAAAHRRDENGLRISRVDRDAADTSGELEPHVRPRLTGVGRPVHTVANLDVRPNERIASARPDDVLVRSRDGERADRHDVLVVEDGVPMHTAVDGLEDAT